MDFPFFCAIQWRYIFGYNDARLLCCLSILRSINSVKVMPCSMGDVFMTDESNENEKCDLAISFGVGMSEPVAVAGSSAG